MTSVVLVVLLVTSMLAIGANLTTESFVELTQRPASLAIAVVANVVAVPAVAAIAVSVIDFPAPVALGILVSAAASGGSSGPLLVRHAGGSLALAVSLQAMLALLALAAVPLWMLVLSSESSFDLDRAAALVAGLLVAQVVPFAVGMTLRRRNPETADRVHVVAGRIADLLLLGIILWFAVTTLSHIADLPAATLPVIVMIVVVTLAAYGLPQLQGSSERAAVSMITAVRNLTLALLVVSLSKSPDLAVTTVLTYGFVMYVGALLALAPMRRARVG
ncbi:BASS family bile acid:Na+ symporter [Aeromicrobium panaciterrae]|uniref:BASS family bile acid:Na+ symporter n=1 Tax=Aeromicrobium panaciterrae TaxID=363861 RepID=A0ABU1UM00_9ACTN|nr:bile acid:sodium symporter [Aeromicrobium panaciterrae]MDR7086207.1 BASS family bile acid:Na+ symporter [Aeromicrobium panaciterrae]